MRIKVNLPAVIEITDPMEHSNHEVRVEATMRSADGHTNFKHNSFVAHKDEDYVSRVLSAFDAVPLENGFEHAPVVPAAPEAPAPEETKAPKKEKPAKKEKSTKAGDEVKANAPANDDASKSSS